MQGYILPYSWLTKENIMSKVLGSQQRGPEIVHPQCCTADPSTEVKYECHGDGMKRATYTYCFNFSRV